MASQGSIGIGSILGIPIELNWIFVFMVVAFLFLDTAFGLLLILLFICVLVHELAHSITARRNGVKVSRIVLLPFGGASVIDSTRIDPGIEFNISVVGPLMSLFLGGVFGVFAVISPAGAVHQLLNLLFLLNVFLGVLNIIPAFPMDGGRLFRSYMQRNHNFFDATMITAKVTKVLLVLIVVVTVVWLLFYTAYPLSEQLGDLALTAITVVFLYGGMKAEENSVIVRRNTVGVKVSDAMSRHFAYMDPGASVQQLYKRMRSSGEHTIITRLQKGYGVVDVGRKAKTGSVERISEIAIPVIALDANSSLSDGMGKLATADIALAVVKKSGRPVGVLSYPQLQSFIALHMMEKKRADAE